jgi:DNA invertase Pin-like site-specific DNA recombinase
MKKSQGNRTDQPPRAFGLVRVSTEAQSKSNAGLSAQRAAIKAHAARKGISDLEIIEEPGVSGATLKKRPILQETLDRLAHGEADLLIVKELSRLTRSLRDFVEIVERSRSEGWGLVLCDADVDGSTPSGSLQLNIYAVFAQHQREMISQLTREGLAEKRKAGVVLGRPRSLDGNTRSQIIEWRNRDGWTLQKICDELATRNIHTATGKAWRKSTVLKIVASAEAA